MSLPRKHNLEQLKRLRKITKGHDIGDIVKNGEKKKEDKMPNSYWMDNPFDRNIDTYESFVNKNKVKSIKENLDFEDESFIIWENYLSQNEDFVNKNQMNIELIVNDIIEQNKYKDGIDLMKDEFYGLVEDHFNMEFVDESVFNRGKGPGNNDYFSNNFKRVLNTQISPSTLQIGKYVKVGKIQGYIDSVDNDYVYISSIKGDNVKEKIPFKKFLKEIEKEGIITENSGLPSEFWMDDDVETIDDFEDIEVDDFEDIDVDIKRISTPKHPKRITQTPKKPNKYPNDLPGRRINPKYGTEDNPMGVSNENIYNHEFKTVQCDDCGQMVEDTYKAKVAHIYNKHFNKPEMDGVVPSKIDLPYGSWPQGGKKTKELVNKYFPQ